MPMTRLVLAASGALIAFSVSAQFVPRPRKPEPIRPDCPLQPATCQANVQTFDFGRGQMSQTAPPINGQATISVTCTRAARDGLNVTVRYLLKAVPAQPARQMRDRNLDFLSFDMFVDPARTRYWGDGYAAGTFPFEGELLLDDRNRVGTLVHVIYGQVNGAQTFTRPGQWLGLVGVQVQYDPRCH